MPTGFCIYVVHVCGVHLSVCTVGCGYFGALGIGGACQARRAVRYRPLMGNVRRSGIRSTGHFPVRFQTETIADTGYDVVAVVVVAPVEHDCMVGDMAGVGASFGHYFSHF